MTSSTVLIRDVRRYIRAIVENEISKLSPHKKGTVVSTTAGDEYADKIKDDIYAMIKTSYAKIGGNATISSPDDIYSEYDASDVIDVDDDPEPGAAIGYKYAHGRKIGYSATDGTPAGKAAGEQMRVDLILKTNGWCEVSDAIAHITINKHGFRPIEDEDQVRALLPGKKIIWHGEHPDPTVAKRFPNTHGWYTRVIGGEPHVKTVIGNPIVLNVRQ